MRLCVIYLSANVSVSYPDGAEKQQNFCIAISHEPWVLAYPTFTQKNALKGAFFLVYPLAFCRFRFADPRQGFALCAHANRGFSPIQRLHKKTPSKGRFFWCTRWGSNPDSTASEAVMLSSYTTDTKSFFQKAIIFYYFSLSICKRLCHNILKLMEKIFPYFNKFILKRSELCRKRLSSV